MKSIESSSLNDFRHKLIQEEFRDILQNGKYELSIDTDGVVVLSAKEFVYDKDGKVDYANVDNLENKARINQAIEVIKEIVAKKISKSTQDVQVEDIIKYGPKLILNGTDKQLPIMESLSHELGFPSDSIVLLDSGEVGKANTKTQFEEMENIKHSFKNLIFVTSSYHVPRTRRTMERNLDKEIAGQVIPVQGDIDTYNIHKNVYNEVKKIEKYIKSGDINN